MHVHMTELSTSLPGERQRRILDLLRANGRVLAADLAQQFDTSEDTIRRDLRQLAKAGLCRRVYGGALPLSPSSTPYETRLAEATERKAELGLATAALVQERLRAGGVLFLDGGSTNLAAARALPDLEITAVTNAPAIAAELMTRAQMKVVMIGGQIDRVAGAALGARAVREAAAIRPDLLLLGACALNAAEGAACFEYEDAAFKQAITEAAGAVALAITNEKLGAAAPYRVAPLSRIDQVVLEADAGDVHVRSLADAGVDVRHAARA